MFSRRVLEMKAPPIYELMELAKGFKDVIYLNLGQPDFDLPDFLKEEGIKAILGGKNKYTGSMGLREFREFVANYESSYLKRDLSVENVIIVSGATLGLAESVLSFANPGDEVMVLDPWWPGHPRSVILADAKPVPIKLREEEGYKIDLDEINEKISEKTRGIIIVNPNNPTGAVFSKSELRGLYELAEDYDLIIISDEVYDKIVYEGDFVSMGEIADDLERVIIVRSFSKSYAMAGWRIGYLISGRERIKALQKMNLALFLSPPSVAQYIAIKALQEEKKFVKAMVEEFKKRRDIVVKKLLEAKVFRFLKPRGTFYIFPRYIDIEMKSIDFTKYLLEKAHVLVSPGYIYFGYTGEYHIRISYSVSTDDVKEGMERIKDAVLELVEE